MPVGGNAAIDFLKQKEAERFRSRMMMLQQYELNQRAREAQMGRMAQVQEQMRLRQMLAGRSPAALKLKQQEEAGKAALAFMDGYDPKQVPPQLRYLFEKVRASRDGAMADRFLKKFWPAPLQLKEVPVMNPDGTMGTAMYYWDANKAAMGTTRTPPGATGTAGSGSRALSVPALGAGTPLSPTESSILKRYEMH